MTEVCEQAFKDFKKGMKYKEIAEIYGVSISTVKSWKSRYWASEKMQLKNEKVATNNKKGCNQKGERLQPKSKATRTENIENDCGSLKNENCKAENNVAIYEGLTDKQRLFCIYWVKNKNATMAAIKAGYSPDNAHVEGSRLLRNAKVREYIEMFISEVKNNILLDTSEIVERYMRIAFADMTDFVDFFQEDVPLIIKGNPVMTKDAITGDSIPVLKTVNTMRFKDAALVDGGLICEISQGKDGAKIKLEDRQKALDWLAKYFLMNPLDRHKIEYDYIRLELTKANEDKQGDNLVDDWVESIIGDEDE